MKKFKQSFKHHILVLSSTFISVFAVVMVGVGAFFGLNYILYKFVTLEVSIIISCIGAILGAAIFLSALLAYIETKS